MVTMNYKRSWEMWTSWMPRKKRKQTFGDQLADSSTGRHFYFQLELRYNIVLVSGVPHSN